MGDNSGTWQAFTKVNYLGSQAHLKQGKSYNSPREMGLNDPVNSLRKAK